jgi:ADP-ribose pyrophosphatase YjhB (NUDIX family)
MLEKEYSFCPKCGGALDSKIMKVNEPARLVCTQCQFIFFLDPKVAACTIFTLKGKVILLQRGIEPSFGKWVFPGGYVDRGETVQQAAIRETKEEVNLDVRLVSLLDVYSYAQSPVVVIVYAAEIVGGTLRAADESLSVQTFAPQDIPWTELAFSSTFQALQDYVRLYFGLNSPQRKESLV